MRTATVNDLDGFLANFWRAVQDRPDLVAKKFLVVTLAIRLKITVYAPTIRGYDYIRNIPC
jgi:hypothetical protein